MCPRPRKASDEEVFAAAQRAMSRLGPGELTLADVAAEAGLSAGALVQRFGGKRDLLVAMSRSASDAPEGFVEGLRAKHRSPLAALRAYARGMAGLAPSPAALARNLAWLQMDLADDELRGQLRAQARATRTGIERLLGDARDAGELAPDVHPPSLARAVETAISGSLMTWACYHEGKAADWLAHDLEAALAPWLAVKRRKR
jgi:AcrR family transcriptional regulator